MRLPALAFDNNGSAILLRMLSGVLFVAMSALVRFLADRTPLGQLVFFRSAFALIPLMLFMAVRHQLPGGLLTRRPLGHLLRSGLGCTAMFLSFAALAHLPLAEAQALAYLAPLFVVVLGIVLLGEARRALRLVAVALGFAGVLVMLLPRMDGLGLAGGDLVGVLCAIGSAFCSAAVVIQIRRLARTERPGTIAFYFAALCTLAGLATVPLGWVRPALPDLVLLVMIGLLGGMAQIAMTVSFARAEASLLAPFEYLTIVWSVLFGILLFAEWPALLFYPAALLVVGAAALVAFDQQRLASIRPRPRAAV